MIERAVCWWQGRTLREQRLLSLLAIIAIPMAFWLMVMRPFGHLLDHQRLQRDAAERMLADVRTMAAELDHIRATPVQGRAGIASAAIRADAEAAGFTVSRADSDGPDGAILVIDAVRAQPFFTWLATTEQRHGLIVTRLTAQPNSDATLAISATLRRRMI
jgi:general secretion pathway protein M